LPIATAVAALSLLQTSEASNLGPLRIGIFTELVVMPVMLAAVLTRSEHARWPIGALVVLAAESVSLRANETPIRAIIAMSMLVLLGTATAAVVYIRLRDSERRTSIENARYNERLDLARELHDVVGHHVTGIVVLAQANRFTNGADPGSAADRALADIEAAGRETLTSVRRLIGLLRTDPSTATGPRLIDVEQLVEDLRSTHPSTDLIIDDAVHADWVPADLATTMHRLVQEAATNVRRHGDPRSPVRFTMGSNGHSFELTVTNRMLHPTVDAGYGLVGMRERVDALGGTFAAGAVGDEQWRVRARLPLIVHSR
jgi:signal transduction histidine kinase